MSLFHIKPARRETEVKVVSDLDRLISEQVGFVLHGKTHAVEPMTMQQFLVVTLELSHLDALKNKAKNFEIKHEDVVSQYHKLFKKCVPSLTREDMDLMTYPQIAGLFQIILDCVGGKAQVETEKKNLIREQA